MLTFTQQSLREAQRLRWMRGDSRLTAALASRVCSAELPSAVGAF
jgi:hypothetical protein